MGLVRKFGMKILLHFKPVSSIVISILFFTHFFVPLTRGSPVHNNEILEASDEAKVARRNLVSMPVQSLETRVSPQTGTAIQKLKQALEKLVVAYLSGIPTDSIPDVKEIEDNLNLLIESRRRPKETTVSVQDGGDPFGYETWFEVEASHDDRRLLQIKATLGVACGTDALLVIFQPDNHGWKEILNWQSLKYSHISGALNAFQYKISPPDSAGKWYVLGADNPAHCASCWGVQRFYVLIPAEQDVHPTVPFQRSDTHYECNEATTLKASSADFEISYPGRSIQIEKLIRPHIRRYQIQNGQFSRLPPVAVTPPDFVDEWIRASWRDASTWCSTPECLDLKSSHELLNVLDRKSGGFEFGGIKQIEPDITDVELWTDDSRPWHFIVKSADKMFIMVQAKRNQ